MKISFPVKIYIIALALRLIPVLLTGNLGIGLDDMFQYDMLARSLASGNGFRWYAQEDLNLLVPYVNFDFSTVSEYDPKTGLSTSFRAPLYPTFLALIYSLFGADSSRFIAARLAQVILLGAPLAPLTYFLSKRFYSRSSITDETLVERISRISAWMIACYPILLVYPLGLGTENLFILLLLASFLFIFNSIETPSIGNFLLSAFFLALTSLTRSVILPFVGLLILYLYFIFREKALYALLAFVIFVSPWIIRNSFLHGKLTGIETSVGYNLYLGYHPKGNGSFTFGPSLDLLEIMDDSERNRVGTIDAIEFIRSAPERFVPLALNRLGFFFGLEKRVLVYYYSNNLLGYLPSPILLLFFAVFLVPFIFLSVIAVLGFAALGRSPQTDILYLLLFAYILPHLLILSEDRFHLALVPFFAMLAAFAMILHKERIYNRLVSPGALGIAIGLIFLLVLNWGLELHRDMNKITAIFGPSGNQTYFPY